MNDGSREQRDTMAGSLERWYRGLLRAYPRRYRRQRGEEMLGTLLDGATPGRSRPSARVAVGLVVAGLRYRFRLRRSPATWVGAVFASVYCGVLVAVAASWVTWQFVAPPQPDERTAAAIAHVVAPGAPLLRQPGYAGDSPEAYLAGSVEFSAQWSGSAPPSAATVCERLRADGWSVAGLRHGESIGSNGVSTFTIVVADKEGLQVMVHEFPEGWTILVSRTEPVAVPVSMAVGLVVGGLFGWLVAVAVSRRTVGQRLGHRTALMVLSIVAYAGLFPLCGASIFVIAQRFLTEGQPEPPWIALAVRQMDLFTAIGAVAAAAVIVPTSRRRSLPGEDRIPT